MKSHLARRLALASVLAVAAFSVACPPPWAFREQRHERHDDNRDERHDRHDDNRDERHDRHDDNRDERKGDRNERHDGRQERR